MFIIDWFFCSVVFEAEIYALTKEEGGRHTPFVSNYRPQFFFRTADITGSVILNTDEVQMVMPGDNVTARVELVRQVFFASSLVMLSDLFCYWQRVIYELILIPEILSVNIWMMHINRLLQLQWNLVFDLRFAKGGAQLVLVLFPKLTSSNSSRGEDYGNRINYRGYTTIG